MVKVANWHIDATLKFLVSGMDTDGGVNGSKRIWSDECEQV